MSGQQPDRHDASDVFQPLGPGDPATVAGYRLAARLGAGGMGKVYLSYTPGGRPVAIKVIRPEFAEDAEFRRRFAQEVKAAQRVQGLYTAPVIDADTDGEHPWLATAYVPGPSLADAVSTHGALPVETVLLLIAGMAEALHVIHGAGIVHRDLKPSNVLLAVDGPRVIDFGIARAADSTSLTGSGVTIGTPSFMAPEQAAARPVTAATDIFALGQIAAYAATGTPAFGEGTGHGVLYRIVHEEPELGPLPDELRDLVGRCLTKDPEGRPSLTEVIGLCQSANSQTVLRRPEDWLPGAVAADITVRTAAPAPPQTPPPAAYSPTVPTTGPAAHPTPPPAAYQPTAPAHPAPQHAPNPAYTQNPAYAPTQFPPHAQQFPGHPRPLPPRKSSNKGPILAAAAALVLGVLGVTAYNAVKDNDKGDDKSSGSGQSSSAPQETGSSGSGDQSGSSTGGGEQKPVADPSPAAYKGINLTRGYHLSFSDDPVRPQEGEDLNYDLSYDTGDYLDAESEGGKLVLLDPGQQGSLETCRNDTRFTETIETNKLSKGRQVCVITGSGHLGLITVLGFAAEDSPSQYMTMDLTVWRNGAAS
ncbi:serine/threonine-protein kinase [Streptomyces sp. NPDC050095]|uniref:serine/threonine-protein kinase n=1 Tax=unclassified Streptomyces TaxID=2593676 RepID=UPI0034402D0A